MSRINVATNTVDATITVGDRPEGVAISPAGTFAYVANNAAGTVSRINLATNTVDATITVGVSPLGVAINPAGTFAYVTNKGSGTVSKISLPSTVPVVTTTKSVAAKILAAYAKLTVSQGATISLRVASSSTKYCKVSGTILKGVKAGPCKVAVTVKPKTGKSVSKTVTLIVTT